MSSKEAAVSECPSANLNLVWSLTRKYKVPYGWPSLLSLTRSWKVCFAMSRRTTVPATTMHDGLLLSKAILGVNAFVSGSTIPLNSVGACGSASDGSSANGRLCGTCPGLGSA